jgi:hypothetical protein
MIGELCGDQDFSTVRRRFLLSVAIRHPLISAAVVGSGPDDNAKLEPVLDLRIRGGCYRNWPIPQCGRTVTGRTRQISAVLITNPNVIISPRMCSEYNSGTRLRGEGVCRIRPCYISPGRAQHYGPRRSRRLRATRALRAQPSDDQQCASRTCHCCG